jgi:hypothetical protein
MFVPLSTTAGTATRIVCCAWALAAQDVQRSSKQEIETNFLIGIPSIQNFSSEATKRAKMRFVSFLLSRQYATPAI